MTLCLIVHPYQTVQRLKVDQKQKMSIPAPLKGLQQPGSCHMLLPRQCSRQRQQAGSSARQHFSPAQQLHHHQSKAEPNARNANRSSSSNSLRRMQCAVALKVTQKVQTKRSLHSHPSAYSSSSRSNPNSSRNSSSSSSSGGMSQAAMTLTWTLTKQQQMQQRQPVMTPAARKGVGALSVVGMVRTAVRVEALRGNLTYKWRRWKGGWVMYTVGFVLLPLLSTQSSDDVVQTSTFICIMYMC
jgi:hypothetical protein